MAARLYDDRLGEALSWAAELFACKARKAAPRHEGRAVPYVSHLLAVTALVLEHGGSQDEAIAAVLHDALEDIEGCDAAQIEARFGAPVASLVLALSDTLHPGHKEPWRERKVKHLARLRTASPAAKRIALADKVHNASTLVDEVALLGDAAFAPFTAGKDGTLWYYRAALDALGDAPAPGLRARLAEAVQALERAR